MDMFEVLSLIAVYGYLGERERERERNGKE
jgi:hypothetical protein